MTLSFVGHLVQYNLRRFEHLDLFEILGLVHPKMNIVAREKKLPEGATQGR